MTTPRFHIHIVVAIAIAVLVGAVTPAVADAVADKRAAQNKLLAYRAARADAIRKLAEQIKGLLITSETTVEDFVTTSDRIETAMTAYLSGMREVGKPQYMEDGTCEVVMEVTLQEIITTLKRFHRQYYKGDKIRHEEFDKMTVTNNRKVIRVTGNGVLNPELTEPPISDVSGGNLSSLKHMSSAAKEYWLARCTGRGRLMAVRAARVDALRRLGERIRGVMITSRTSVQDFVAESDQIDVDMRAFIRGAKETGISYHENELIVEVEMQVALREILTTIQQWAREHYHGDKVTKSDFQKVIIRSKDKKVRETGMGVPPEKYLKDVTPGEQAVISLAGTAPGWATTTLSATGQAAIDTVTSTSAAQAKLMAMRAAELDARRKLAERINGLVISSQTTVQDFVAQRDDIRTSMLAFQQGARVLEDSKTILEDGTAEVTVEIDLKPLWRRIIYFQEKYRIIEFR